MLIHKESLWFPVYNGTAFCQQMLRVYIHNYSYPELDVCSENGAGDSGKASRHHRVQLRPRHVADQWSDHERRFALKRCYSTYYAS